MIDLTDMREKRAHDRLVAATDAALRSAPASRYPSIGFFHKALGLGGAFALLRARVDMLDHPAQRVSAAGWLEAVEACVRDPQRPWPSPMIGLAQVPSPLAQALAAFADVAHAQARLLAARAELKDRLHACARVAPSPYAAQDGGNAGTGGSSDSHAPIVRLEPGTDEAGK